MSPSPAAPSVSQLRDGDQLQMILLVHEASMRTTRRGAPFVSARLGDRSATFPAVMWDAPSQTLEAITPGAPVRVTGRFSDHPRYGRQIIIETLEPLDRDAVRWEDLLAGPACDPAELGHELDELIESVANPDLSWLLHSLLGADTLTGAHYRVAPAAKYNHHAYHCGLLEHSVWVAHAVDRIARLDRQIDRDLAVSGALLHDIGKLEAYERDGILCDLSDLGRLHGEIPLGYYLIRRLIEQRPGFPPALAERLLHTVLSHHGLLEHGSPVLPSTREALLVHSMDKLSGDLGSYDRLQAESDAPDAWSRFDHALRRSVLLRAA
jgi:3'-5' exoribonuclease